MKAMPNTPQIPLRRDHADVSAPPAGEARARITARPGFFASLSPEARSTIAGSRGPATLGRVND